MCVADADGEDFQTSTLNGDARPYESTPTTPTRESRTDLTPFTLVTTTTGTKLTATTKSNRRNNNKKRSKEATSTIYPQNIQGGKDPLKLEYITAQMKKRGIDIYLLKKTWLCGDYDKDINGYLMFHHGLESPTCNRGTGGVAIILSPRAKTAWDNAGNPPPIHGGVIATTTRIIGLQLDLDTGNNQGINKLFVCSIYCPDSSYDDDDIEYHFDKIKERTLAQ
eukprot:scaffold99797_cov38-Attheya_sp.AAC.1